MPNFGQEVSILKLLQSADAQGTLRDWENAALHELDDLVAATIAVRARDEEYSGESETIKRNHAAAGKEAVDAVLRVANVLRLIRDLKEESRRQ